MVTIKKSRSRPTTAKPCLSGLDQINEMSIGSCRRIWEEKVSTTIDNLDIEIKVKQPNVSEGSGEIFCDRQLWAELTRLNLPQSIKHEEFANFHKRMSLEIECAR